MLDRRTLLAAATAAGAAPLIAPFGAARAQDYPTQPIRMIVPFAAGGPTDVPARLIAEHAGAGLPQKFVVENRTGSGVVIGTDLVAKAPKDGYTVLYTTVAHTVLRVLFPRLAFDPVGDFTPVVLIGQIPCVLSVNDGVPAKTLPEFVKLLRDNPGKYSYASSGNGGAVHLATALFLSMIGAEANHVPYRGSAAAYPDLIAGRVHFIIDVGINSSRQPNLRALALSSLERSPLAPDLPTFDEQGVKGYEAYTWHMLFVPSGTPSAVVARLNEAVNKALAIPDLRQKLGESQFMTMKGGSQADAAAFLKSETEKWEGIVRRQNITADG